jgi:hypothetical protein
MNILDTVNKSIRAYMGAAATTNQPIFVCSYADHTSSTFVPGANDGTLNGTTPVTLVAAPAGSTQRQIKYINIWNNDTVSQSVTIELLSTSAQRTLFRCTLDPGSAVTFTEGIGWVVFNNQGVPRSGGIVVNTGRLMAPPIVDVTANITGTKAITTTQTALVYVGVAGRAASSVTLRYNVTVAAVTITWAEIAIFKGIPLVAANPSLSLLGWADVAGVINTTGRKSTNITLLSNISIGDELWIGIGNQATTAVTIRAYSLVEDCQVGTVVMMVARPSTVASPSSWTINNAVAPWMYCYLN